MLVSIVTINFNNLEGLKQTLESVRQQSFKDYEHILIDGGSTDGSVELIKAYTGTLGKWLSEKDKGVYDAQNKGIAKSKGTYVLFLNSGDYFCNQQSLENLAQYNSDYDLVYGDIIYKKGVQLNPHYFPELVDEKFMFEKGLPHPSTLIRRSLFEKIGLYNASLKIVADWEFFMLALFKHGATTAHVAVPVTVFDCTGISSANKNIALTINEQLQVLNRNFPESIPAFNKYSYYTNKQRKLKQNAAPFRRILRSFKNAFK